MQTIGVIGAGQMGTGIAQTVAQHGMQVLLSDVDLARAEAGKAGIEKALGKLVGRGKIEIDQAEAKTFLHKEEHRIFIFFLVTFLKFHEYLGMKGPNQICNWRF